MFFIKSFFFLFSKGLRWFQLDICEAATPVGTSLCLAGQSKSWGKKESIVSEAKACKIVACRLRKI